jgi:hypothetical protein
MVLACVIGNREGKEVSISFSEESCGRMKLSSNSSILFFLFL